MLRTPVILALLLLSGLAAPFVLATPIASVGTVIVQTDFGGPGVWGRCAQNTLVSAEHVNSRLLVTIQSGTQGLLDSVPPRTNTDCGLTMAIEPGVFVNPCDFLTGSFAPAVSSTDPYFYPYYNSEYWRKTISFSNGGTADFVVRLSTYAGSRDALIYGDCRVGSYWGTWGGSYQRVDIG